MKTFKTQLGIAYNGDCFEIMKILPNGCIDMILADLPYGTTACKWDTVIPFDKLWKEFNRICKPNAPIVLFGSEPFSTALRMSNLNNYRYDWYWLKDKAGNFVQGKRMPLKVIETISVFSDGGKMPTYFPIMVEREKPITRGNASVKGQLKNLEAAIPSKNKGSQTYTHFSPKTILPFPVVRKTIHPTQKPVALFEYLIKTYTNEGQTVFDPTAGSLTTGVAAENLNRHWICCEKDIEHGYFDKGVSRFNKE